MNTKNKTLCIIPARGGSKRIPRKNIRKFLNKPIIEYSISKALESKLFDVVMVSTDDSEIAEIAKLAGADVPFLRSVKNSNDHAGTAEVILEVLEEYSKTDRKFDFVCCIYPTAPFVTVENLQIAYKMLNNEKTEGVFPIVKYSYPVQRSLEILDNRVYMVHPENYQARSQDLKPIYHDSGQFYFLQCNSFSDQKKLFLKNSMFIELSELEVQDIDNEGDWKLAELKYKLLLNGIK